jgi:AcrR family transcriptional regulator
MAASRQQGKAATRAKVLEAAKALFEDVGYASATIRDIAARAGMSTGAVFASFEDKAAVYRALYGHAPISPEVGRALYLAAQPAMNEPGPYVERLGAVLAMVEEA